MSEDNTKTVFHLRKAGYEESDPHSWNDLAIVDAYNQAVSTNLKIMENLVHSVPLGDRMIKKTSGEINHQPEVKKKTKKRRRRVRKKPWKPGDNCLALFKPEQRYYKATILNISNNIAIVRYEGYQQTENVPIHECHPLHLWKGAEAGPGHDHYEDRYDEPDEYMDTNSFQKRRREDENHYDFVSNENNNYDDGFPLPNMPPLNSTRPNAGDFRNLPKDCSNVSKEALSSMLVSWYMAGYQTGYYRGLTSHN